MTCDEIDAAALRTILHYEPATGIFTWKIYCNARAKVGSVAGTVNSRGYVMIKALGKLHSAHRLAWFYMTGAWPHDQIDHKNNLKTDNRFENLRQATKTDNNRNRRFSKNSTGFKGVTFVKSRQQWRANIWENGKQKFLGCFDNPEAAHEAYKTAATEKHGEFANY